MDFKHFNLETDSIFLLHLQIIHEIRNVSLTLMMKNLNLSWWMMSLELLIGVFSWLSLLSVTCSSCFPLKSTISSRIQNTKINFSWGSWSETNSQMEMISFKQSFRFQIFSLHSSSATYPWPDGWQSIWLQWYTDARLSWYHSRCRCKISYYRQYLDVWTICL